MCRSVVIAAWTGGFVTIPALRVGPQRGMQPWVVLALAIVGVNGIPTFRVGVKHVERNARHWLRPIQRAASDDQPLSRFVPPSNNNARWSIFRRGVLGREVLLKSKPRCLSQDGYTQGNRQDHDPEVWGTPRFLAGHRFFPPVTFCPFFRGPPHVDLGFTLRLPGVPAGGGGVPSRALRLLSRSS